MRGYGYFVSKPCLHEFIWGLWFIPVFKSGFLKVLNKTQIWYNKAIKYVSKDKLLPFDTAWGMEKILSPNKGGSGAGSNQTNKGKSQHFESLLCTNIFFKDTISFYTVILSPHLKR